MTHTHQRERTHVGSMYSSACKGVPENKEDILLLDDSWDTTIHNTMFSDHLLFKYDLGDSRLGTTVPLGEPSPTVVWLKNISWCDDSRLVIPKCPVNN